MMELLVVLLVVTWLIFEFTRFRNLCRLVGGIAVIAVFILILQQAMYRGKGDSMIHTSLDHLSARLQRGETNEVMQALNAISGQIANRLPHPSIAFARENDLVFNDCEFYRIISSNNALKVAAPSVRAVAP